MRKSTTNHTEGTDETTISETALQEAGIEIWPTMVLADPAAVAVAEPVSDASRDDAAASLLSGEESANAQAAPPTHQPAPEAATLEADAPSDSLQNQAADAPDQELVTTGPAAAPVEIVVSFRADASEPQPTHQEPHPLGDTWPANRTVLVGRVQRLKGRAPRVRPTEGGAYTLYTLHVAEAASDDLYADVAQTRVPLLVPDSLPRAAQKLLGQDGLISIQGRVTQETVEDRRYSDQRGTGKQVLTLPYIKVQDVRAVAPTSPQYAVIRVAGTIQRVTGVGVRLARGRADRYHIVELVATETYQRPAPAVGTRTLHTPIYVAVPEDAAHADLVLRKGNHFEVECELIELGEFLPEDHYALQGLSEEDRQRRRRRDRIYLVATRLQPVGAATPLSNHDRKALVYRLQQGGQRRVQQPRRQPRAEAS